MRTNTLLSAYSSTLPAAGGSWPSSGVNVAQANGTQITIAGTTHTLNTGAGVAVTATGPLTVTVPAAMRLRLELWGAGGGNSDSSGPSAGGSGGWIMGDLALPAGTFLLYVGTAGGVSGAAGAPDGGIGSVGYSGGASGGGGSTRFGPFYSSDYNGASRTYYLIAAGGGGGTDYAVIHAGRGGYGYGGGFAAADGGYAYNSGENADSPGTGGMQMAGGKTGTFGRQPAGNDGAYLTGGNGSGGGGGGGYYGGGGARGYYAQGGGGSSYFDENFVRNVLCMEGGWKAGVSNNHNNAPHGTHGKPASTTGEGSGNGGARFRLWVP